MEPIQYIQRIRSNKASKRRLAAPKLLVNAVNLTEIVQDQILLSYHGFFSCFWNQQWSRDFHLLEPRFSSGDSRSSCRRFRGGDSGFQCSSYDRLMSCKAPLSKKMALQIKPHVVSVCCAQSLETDVTCIRFRNLHQNSGERRSCAISVLASNWNQLGSLEPFQRDHSHCHGFRTVCGNHTGNRGNGADSHRPNIVDIVVRLCRCKNLMLVSHVFFVNYFDFVFFLGVQSVI